MYALANLKPGGGDIVNLWVAIGCSKLSPFATLLTRAQDRSWSEQVRDQVCKVLVALSRA